MPPASQTRARRPNVVLIMADDMGFSDLGCYGSEIRTPHLDRLAADGVAMSQFYNTARCSPARASLLTGLHPHQTGIGVLTHDDGPQGYPGTINQRCVTIAEILRAQGYRTAMRGKWHLTGKVHEPHDAWPTRRGFDDFYGILAGAGSYYQPVTLTRGEEPAEIGEDFYFTSVLGDEAASFITQHAAHGDRGAAGAVDHDDPFFLYLPFTAPHWPLHAPEEIVEHYRGAFDDGWDVLRERRRQRLIDAGIITDAWPLSERDEEVVAWDEVADQEWQTRRMEVYAAQVELLDAAVGRVVDALTETGQLDNTLIMFLSDNGGCAEEFAPGWVDELPHPPLHTPLRTADGERVRRGNDPSVEPGGPATFASYGKPWANLSNTPFREYKHWVHEGGIATPFIAHWPAGGLRSGIDHDPHQLPDVLATVLEATGVDYPAEYPGRDLLPPEGTSMLGSWRGTPTPQRPLFFEHEGNAAVRAGRWKLVRKHGLDWELYDLDRDRTELDDLAGRHPDRVAVMARCWQDWADRCQVKPRDQVLAATGGDRPLLVVKDFVSSRRR
ncbi:arylsulfatase [Microlunatus soli]|uniref:Arylsulfatase n=1 Tax=Microlunatus soli TaxID=630515 RepID=A0A1H1Z2G7_9ACTN|nr:arylsulfatase [Microlunatus soli]SDT27870.1 arylsulfatase [Microlunatus soli]